MLLDDIRTYLVNQGLVTTAWKCYIAYMADDVDQTMSLFETPGKPAFTLGRESERVAFQLRVRGARQDYIAARTQWQAAFTALQDSTPTADYTFIQTAHYGPIFFNDDKGRPNFISNFNVLRTIGGTAPVEDTFQDGAFQ